MHRRPHPSRPLAWTRRRRLHPGGRLVDAPTRQPRQGPLRGWRCALPLAVAVALVASLVGCAPRPTLRELDRKLYATSLPTFLGWWRQEQATAHHVSVATIDRWWQTRPERLDDAAARRRPWDVSTDFCSFAPDTGPVFDFRGPCVRHDFAWRNLHRLDQAAGGGISTRARRLAASRQFLDDLRATCDGRPAVQRPACRAVAATYFAAVSAAA